MNCLITGAGGFVGRHLAEFLRAQGAQVTALERGQCDVLDAAGLRAALAAAAPDRVFHLAAQSLPGVSWERPAATFRVNVEGTLNLLEAVRLLGRGTTVVVAGSSSEYAARADGAPIRETDARAPLSPYAASKLAADECAALYARRYGLKVVRVRPFFLIGRYKTGDVCSDLARRIVAAERGGAPQIAVGRLDMVRDFLDVRDGVEAMALLAAEGVGGEDYNICSGRGRSIAEVFEGLRALARTAVTERVDAALQRPLDEKVKIGDPGKLMARGWRPRRAFEESLADILEYWRRQA